MKTVRLTKKYDPSALKQELCVLPLCAGRTSETDLPIVPLFLIANSYLFDQCHPSIAPQSIHSQCRIISHGRGEWVPLHIHGGE